MDPEEKRVWWWRLQALKTRVREHLDSHPVWSRERKYWWTHYEKLCTLQDGLKYGR